LNALGIAYASAGRTTRRGVSSNGS
jgi:hypothetical protein